MTLCSFFASAQQNEVPLSEPNENRPTLFAAKPDKVLVEPFQITSLLATKVGESVILNFPGLRFEGNVISSVSKYENTMQSV